MMSVSASAPLLGGVALLGYLVHGAVHVRRGTPDELLWACHLGAVLVGVGMIGGWPVAVTVGVEWLVVGNLLWGIGLAAGAHFMPTSVLTHLLGLGIGLAGLRIGGIAPGAWRLALPAVLLLFAVSWFVAPARSRVNLVHGMSHGFDRYFRFYPLYIGTVLVASAAVFAATERVLIRLGFPAVR